MHKPSYKILSQIASVSMLAFALSGCADFVWSIAHSSSAMGSLNKRMNDRMYARQFNGDPLNELEWNNKHGDFRFRGLQDISVRPFRKWLPGIPNSQFPVNHSEYLCYSQESPWLEAAVRYYETYNRALLLSRRGKKLDDHGREVR